MVFFLFTPSAGNVARMRRSHQLESAYDSEAWKPTSSTRVPTHFRPALIARKKKNGQWRRSQRGRRWGYSDICFLRRSETARFHGPGWQNCGLALVMAGAETTWNGQRAGGITYGRRPL